MIFIFDLDGTLVDTTELHCQTFVDAFKDFGQVVSPKSVRELIGMSGEDMAKRLGAEDPAAVFARKTELFINRLNEVEEIDGATEVLEELKSRGYAVCVATACNREMTDAIIGKFGWDLDMVVTSDDVVHSKPAPDTLNRILDRFEGPAVFIGDSKYDREMAGRARIPSYILGDDVGGLRDVLKL